MKRLVTIFCLAILLSFVFTSPVNAQERLNVAGSEIDTTTTPPVSVTATPSATPTTTKKDITLPQKEQNTQYLALLEKRDASKLSFTNFMAYGVQYAIKNGVPSNTVILILLLPFLATIVVFFRYVIGLSGLGLLVPIALSITLLSTGLLAGFILLATILITSYLARIILKRLRIMQLPKLALSMWLVAIATVAMLTISTTRGILSVQDLSIFPILLLVILSDRIVALFLERSMLEVVQITLITFLLGLIGFFLLSWDAIRNIIITYPELILLCVPLNILIGRYFGLRITEYIRFKSIIDYGSK